MANGSGNGSCSCYGAPGKLPMSSLSGPQCGTPPLAQVNQFHDLVTGSRLSGVSTSEPGDRSAIFIYLFLIRSGSCLSYHHTNSITGRTQLLGACSNNADTSCTYQLSSVLRMWLKCQHMGIRKLGMCGM